MITTLALRTLQLGGKKWKNIVPLIQPQRQMPTPVSYSTPLAQKNEKVISIQKSTDKKVDNSNVTILVGSASRRIYLSKKKVGLLSRSSPKLFALKLFELVFRREEAKEGSVEGKGEKLHQLDPNRLSAVREHTERMFPNEVNWPTIKKAIDEKCRYGAQQQMYSLDNH